MPQDPELYGLAQSEDRVAKERSMRRRQLKWLWRRLKELQVMDCKRDELLKKLGAAQHQAPSAWRLVTVAVEKKEARFTQQFSLWSFYSQGGEASNWRWVAGRVRDW